MELELKRKKMKVTVYGSAYDVAVPTVEQVEAYEDKLKTLVGRDAMNAMKEFIADLGIPVEVTNKMDNDDFITLIGFISNPKKK